MKTLLSDYNAISAQMESLFERRKAIRDEIIEHCKDGYTEGRYKLKLSKRKGGIDYKAIVDEMDILFEPDTYRKTDVYVINIIKSNKSSTKALK